MISPVDSGQTSPCTIPGLEEILLIPIATGVLDGQEIPRRDGKPAQLMRQLLLEMLKEESWIETVGEATQEADIRKLVEKTAPDPVVVTAVRPAGRRPSAMSVLSEFLDFSAQ